MSLVKAKFCLGWSQKSDIQSRRRILFAIADLKMEGVVDVDRMWMAYKN